MSFNGLILTSDFFLFHLFMQFSIMLAKLEGKLAMIIYIFQIVGSSILKIIWGKSILNVTFVEFTYIK